MKKVNFSIIGGLYGLVKRSACVTLIVAIVVSRCRTYNRATGSGKSSADGTPAHDCDQSLQGQSEVNEYDDQARVHSISDSLARISHTLSILNPDAARTLAHCE